MASINSEINLSVDPFITNTRIKVCFAENCINNINRQCRYKEVKIRDDGSCGSYYVKKARRSE